jgi:hypothetical protein
LISQAHFAFDAQLLSLAPPTIIDITPKHAAADFDVTTARDDFRSAFISSDASRPRTFTAELYD